MDTKTFLTFSIIALSVSIAAADGISRAIPVSIEKTAAGYQLLRGGEPYFIRGAGGTDHLDRLKAVGGNSIRTWGEEQTDKVLARAHELDLTVTAGLWIEHERKGFDYGDAGAVKAQLEKHKQAVDRIKDHPALLMWGVGNEVELQHTDPRVWDFVEAVAAYIRKVDPHHPVMTVIAHPSQEVIREIQTRCPSVQLIGFNDYGGLRMLQSDLRRFGWDGPYVVTEWGTDGSWEVPKTSWGAEIEPTSTEKARTFALRYSHILGDAGRCLGSYVFVWGNKQETTATWFGLFLADGSEVEAVEVLQYLWSKTAAAVPAPQVGSLRLNGMLAQDEPVLKAGTSGLVSIPVSNYSPDVYEIVWMLKEEAAHKGIGGDDEQMPDIIQTTFKRVSAEKAVFQIPLNPGEYRVYATIRGPGNKVATANIPFLVK